jgi:hypothetical protein
MIARIWAKNKQQINAQIISYDNKVYEGNKQVDVMTGEESAILHGETSLKRYNLNKNIRMSRIDHVCLRIEIVKTKTLSIFYGLKMKRFNSEVYCAMESRDK